MKIKIKLGSGASPKFTTTEGCGVLANILNVRPLLSVLTTQGEPAHCRNFPGRACHGPDLSMGLAHRVLKGVLKVKAFTFSSPGGLQL